MPSAYLYVSAFFEIIDDSSNASNARGTKPVPRIKSLPFFPPITVPLSCLSAVANRVTEKRIATTSGKCIRSAASSRFFSSHDKHGGNLSLAEGSVGKHRGTPGIVVYSYRTALQKRLYYLYTLLGRNKTRWLNLEAIISLPDPAREEIEKLLSRRYL